MVCHRHNFLCLPECQPSLLSPLHSLHTFSSIDRSYKCLVSSIPCHHPTAPASKNETGLALGLPLVGYSQPWPEGAAYPQVRPCPVAGRPQYWHATPAYFCPFPQTDHSARSKFSLSLTPVCRAKADSQLASKMSGSRCVPTEEPVTLRDPDNM